MPTVSLEDLFVVVHGPSYGSGSSCGDEAFTSQEAAEVAFAAQTLPGCVMSVAEYISLVREEAREAGRRGDEYY